MKTAIILGGTHDHIELILLLKKKGYHTVLADYLDNPPAKVYVDEFAQKSILDKEGILELAKEKNASLVIATCIDQALETSAYVSEKLNLPCHINYQTALTLTNKRFMKQKMKEYQIPTSDFFILKNEFEFDTIDRLTYPLVIKPVDANSSKGVFKIEQKEEIQHFYEISKAYSKTGEVIIEEFVEGMELSIDVFVQDSRATVLMITENIKLKTSKQSFTIAESYYNKRFEDKLKTDIEQIANQIARAFKITDAPLLIQCIYNEEKNQISVIEFSSRIGGGSKHLYIKTITQFDILNAFVDTVVGNSVPPVLTSSSFSLAKIRYLYTRPGVINEFKHFDDLKTSEVVQEYFLYKTQGSHIKESIKSTDRSAGFFIVAKEQQEFIFKEQVVMDTIEILDEYGNDMLLR